MEGLSRVLPDLHRLGINSESKNKFEYSRISVTAWPDNMLLGIKYRDGYTTIPEVPYSPFPLLLRLIFLLPLWFTATLYNLTQKYLYGVPLVPNILSWIGYPILAMHLVMAAVLMPLNTAANNIYQFFIAHPYVLLASFVVTAILLIPYMTGLGFSYPFVNHILMPFMKTTMNFLTTTISQLAPTLSVTAVQAIATSIFITSAFLSSYIATSCAYLAASQVASVVVSAWQRSSFTRKQVKSDIKNYKAGKKFVEKLALELPESISQFKTEKTGTFTREQRDYIKTYFSRAWHLADVIKNPKKSTPQSALIKAFLEQRSNIATVEELKKEIDHRNAKVAKLSKQLSKSFKSMSAEKDKVVFVPVSERHQVFEHQLLLNYPHQLFIDGQYKPPGVVNLEQSDLGITHAMQVSLKANLEDVLARKHAIIAGSDSATDIAVREMAEILGLNQVVKRDGGGFTSATEYVKKVKQRVDDTKAGKDSKTGASVSVQRLTKDFLVDDAHKAMLLAYILGTGDFTPEASVFAVNSCSSQHYIDSAKLHDIMPENNSNIHRHVDATIKGTRFGTTGKMLVDKSEPHLVKNTVPFQCWLLGLPQANTSFSQATRNYISTLDEHCLDCYHNNTGLFTEEQIASQKQRLQHLKKEANVGATPLLIFGHYYQSHPAYKYFTDNHVPGFILFTLLGQHPDPTKHGAATKVAEIFRVASVFWSNFTQYNLWPWSIYNEVSENGVPTLAGLYEKMTTTGLGDDGELTVNYSESIRRLSMFAESENTLEHAALVEKCKLLQGEIKKDSTLNQLLKFG